MRLPVSLPTLSLRENALIYVVKLITGGSLVEEGGHVAVADATDEPDDDEPGTGGTGAQA